MIIEELRFSHLNDSQPSPGDQVFVSDGLGNHTLANLEIDNDIDEFTHQWYCEDTDTAYPLTDYPFWSPIPKFEFPDADRELKVFLRHEDVDEDVEEETLGDGAYEIVGSEIRRK